MDANENGVLEPEEVQGRRREFVERAAEEAGLDPSQPLPIEKLEAAMAARFQRGREGGAERGPPGRGGPSAEGGRPPRPDRPEGDASPDGASPREEPAKTPPSSGVRGFGAAGRVTKAGGFGGPMSGAAATQGAAPTGDRAPADAPAAPETGELRERMTNYAAALVKQNDDNKDGKLQQAEWSKLRGDRKQADRNGDDVITVEEIRDQMLDEVEKRPGPPAPSSPAPNAASLATPPSRVGVDASGRKSYRYRSPHERLPSGLPDWFASRDQNEDGQVAMHEYAARWTDSQAREFASYDQNGDGLITSREAQRSQRSGGE